MDPKDIAGAMRRLRERSLDLIDGLHADELAVEALPGWSVLDVFRHLADSDRRVLLGGHVLEFLPGRRPDDLERANDANLERLRAADRGVVRDELAAWGPRLATIVGLTPGALAALTVPTLFGRVTLAWFAMLRPYDEWVHQWDVLQALDRGVPPMDAPTRDLLAEFHLRALPAGPLRALDRRDAVVEVRFPDTDLPPWRFDLRRREFGAFVRAAPTVTVTADVPSWCLHAAARVPWGDLDGIEVAGRDDAAAAAILDVVRVV